MAAVMIGVDPHKGSHTAVAIGAAEEPLGQVRVRASAAQAERLLAWAAPWPQRTWAAGGAGGLGHLLDWQLVAAGERVLDVPPRLGARVRLLASGNTSKNDPSDARSVAVAALRSAGCRPVRADDHAMVLKVRARRHRDLGRARTQVACRLHAVLCELIPGGFSKRISAAQAARVLSQVTVSGAVARARCELAADFPGDLRRTGAQMHQARKKLAAAVRASGTALTGIFGVGPVVAAVVIGEAGDTARFASRDHFAAYNGTAPAGRVLRQPQGLPAVPARQPPPQPRRAHGGGHPGQPAAQRGPCLLRQEDRRGKDPQGSAAGPQAPGQRRHLQAPEGRRSPRRREKRTGPGRAPGERLCRQRGRIAPRTPALRPGHSRTCPHPTTPPEEEGHVTRYQKDVPNHLTQRGLDMRGAGARAMRCVRRA